MNFLDCCSSRKVSRRVDGEGLEDCFGLSALEPESKQRERRMRREHVQMPRKRPAAKKEESATKKEESLSPKKDPPQTLWSLLRLQLLYVLLFFIAGYCFYGHYSRWSTIDCLYFSVVVVTSVGYGDLLPTTEIEMIFTSVYILAAMVIIISAISRIVRFVISGKVVAALKQAQEAKEQELVRMCNADTFERTDTDELFLSMEDQELYLWKKRMRDCLGTFAMLCIWAGVGVLYFSSQEEFLEGNDNLKDVRPWIGALYFTVVTLTTVGFGDDVPKTDQQKVFCAIFIIFGVPLFGAAITELTALIKREDGAKERALTIISSLDEGKVHSLIDFEHALNAACGQETVQESGDIDRFEYTAFVLVKNGAIKMESLKEIMQSFNKLDMDGSGSISRDDLPPSFG